MWALRKKPEDLEPEEHDVIELLFKYSYELRRAYALCEKLTRIFDTKQTVPGKKSIQPYFPCI